MEISTSSTGRLVRRVSSSRMTRTRAFPGCRWCLRRSPTTGTRSGALCAPTCDGMLLLPRSTDRKPAIGRLGQGHEKANPWLKDEAAQILIFHHRFEFRPDEGLVHGHSFPFRVGRLVADF